MLRSHPLVYKLIESFRKEESLNRKKLNRARSGIQPKKKAEYLEINERIQNILKAYNKNKVFDFLDNINLVLKY
jgi:hypothetical protein